MAFLRLLFYADFLFWMSVCYNLETSHPIIYEVPVHEEKNGYFGMSVAIRPKAASIEDAWIIQIGAPRGNGGVRDSGTVYRCHSHGPCRMFSLDEGLNGIGGRGIHEFREKKDGAWIGVAMEIQRFGSHERSVVCGHRWINQDLGNPEHIDITYLMTGVCYLQDLLNETFEAPVQRLLPLVNKDKIYAPKPYVVDLSTYYWGLGQAGISVKLSEKSSYLLIGAPGVTHWIGSVVRYKNNFDMTVANFAKTEIPRRSRYTYLGYSVAFGRFYKDREIWFASGAPRSANYRGEVFVFRFQDSSEVVRIESNLAGATFGEYFGSSLATADLNSDGYDDLIVGAPLFSRKDSDEGRVYIFLGSGRGNFLVAAQVIEGRVGEGRFGSCVSSLQDLDQDGYDDVAVGAPYEDNNRGAVYIYRGFSKGLQAEFSQIIKAQEIHPFLRGFGASISSAVDIDGNKYFDIGIGSYLSSHVVLIRSRPVISLHPKIRTENISLIDRKESHFNVSICSRFSGSNAPSHVDILRTLVIDPNYNRGTLDSKISVSKKVIRLRANEVICEIHPITLNLFGKIYSPLQITMKNEIEPCENGKGSSLLIKGETTKGTDEFSKMCPLGNKAETSADFAFAGICGSDFTCRSELELSCELPGIGAEFYVLGSRQYLVLSMEVRNRGEPAYHTKIKIWSNLKLKLGNDEPSKKTHWLDVEGILSDNYKTNFSFQIDLDALTDTKGETHFNLRVDIFTSSLESNLKNNFCKFLLELRSDAFLDFRASSSISGIYVSKTLLEGQTLNATHYYEVQKTGVTPLKDVQLSIYVPFWFKRELLTFEVETAEWMHFSRRYEVLQWKQENGNEISSKQLGDDNCPPTNRTLFLNCSTSEIECGVFDVFFTRDIPIGVSSYIKILMSLNVTAIELVKNEKDIVFLTTNGALKFSKLLRREPLELRISASLSLYSEENDVHVDAHVIGLSVLAGGFLLCLIITGLVRKNFFKRAKKEELEALKGCEAGFVYFTTGLNVEAERRTSQCDSPTRI